MNGTNPISSRPERWLALGVGVGVAIGVALKDIAVGVGVGAAVGLVFFLAAKNNSNRNGEKTE